MVVYKATIVNVLGEKQKFTVIGNRITEILNAIEEKYPLCFEPLDLNGMSS